MPELGLLPGMTSVEPRLLLDGEEQPRLSTGLQALLIAETTEGLYRCEARFGDWGSTGDGVGSLYLDRQLLDFGKSIVIELVAGNQVREVFRGRISGIEAQYAQGMPPTITLLAEDRGQDLRMVRRTRVFADMSDATAFEQIAREHSLQPEIDLSGPQHALLAQVNQSDLAFIRERARWLDAEVWLTDRTLRVQARQRRATDDDLTLAIGRGLIEFVVTADLAGQRSSVVVSGWDVLAKERISHEASERALGSELNGDESGAALLSRTFGDRVDRLAHHVPLTSAEAQALAEASFRAQARRFVTGTGVARGDARLRVGVVVTLRGLGGPFDGTYYVCEVRHVFARGADGGYRTEFTVERPGVAQ